MAYINKVVYAPDEAAYWTAQPLDDDAFQGAAGPSVVGASRVICSYTRTAPTTLGEDRAQFGIWVAAHAIGDDLIPLSPTQQATAETGLNTFTTALAGFQHPDYKLVEYTWRNVDQDSERTEDGRGQIMTPPTRVTSKSVTGGGSGNRLPDQCASTITVRTCGRRHWGRSYIPGLTGNALESTFGRWKTATADALTAAMDALHDTWQSSSLELGVYSMLHPAFLTAKAVEADDIVDIVRRRRAKSTGYRSIINS